MILDMLQLQIARARRYFRSPGAKSTLDHVLEQIEAASVTGTSLALNATEAEALQIYIESERAMRGIRTLAAQLDNAQTPAEVTNVIRDQFCDGN